MNNRSKKNAFTLSEVLTTLMIVGVVAAITIPALNSNITEETKLKSLRAFNNAFNQNILTTIAEDACDSLSCLNKWGDSANANIMHNGALEKYLNYASRCIPDTTIPDAECLIQGCKDEKDTKQEGCVNELCKDKQGQEKDDCLTEEHDECSYDINECYDPKCTGSGCWGNSKAYCMLDGADCKNINYNKDFRKYLLTNAMSLAIVDFPGNCANEDIAAEDGESSLYACSLIYVDVNGIKGPNQAGNDIFAFYILDKPINNVFLFPFGGEIDFPDEDGAVHRYSLGETQCDPKSINIENRFACTARNLKFGSHQ
ncbi:MAG: type II secretion system protein [Candidatus Gastranaerophilales bacterium]|nr:type II secretion system protein [Candidatus Gastranaerophilales bacterium]